MSLIIIDYPSTTAARTPRSTTCSRPCSILPIASATDLAAADSQRPGYRVAFDELETHQRGLRTVLRSTRPAQPRPSPPISAAPVIKRTNTSSGTSNAPLTRPGPNLALAPPSASAVAN